MSTPDEFWQALVRSRLLQAGAAERLRADHAKLPPAAAGDGSAKLLAAWLVGRRVITRWQAARLVRGEAGPFFLGDHRLLEKHDHAGGASAFTARHEPTGDPATLVILDAKRCRDPGVRDAIVARTAIAVRAADPMLVRVRSLGQDDAVRFIVCEHLVGTTLADEVQRYGPLPPEQAGLVAWQMARAVAELHALGGVHGGLSLDALVREPDPAGGDPRGGRVRLLQFPLVSDPHRLPPPVATAARADVSAIGAVLHALLAGQAPRGPNATAPSAAAAAPDGPRPLPAGVSPALMSVVWRLLDRDQAARIGTAADAADELARCLGITPASAGVTATRPRPPGGGHRRRKTAWLPWVGSGVAALLTAAAAVMMMPRSGERDRGAPVAERMRRVGEPNPPATDAVVAEPTGVGAAAPPPSRIPASRVTIVDDPALPWASPTNGPPPTLAYLLPGAEAVLLVRLADVAADDEGRLFLRALGPAFESAVNRLVSLCGGDVSALESVQAAWGVEQGDEVIGACAVRFAAGRAAPEDAAARETAWGPTQPRAIEDETLFEGESLAFWSPRAEQGRVLVIAPRGAPAEGDASPMERMIREAGPLAADDALPVKAVVPVALETLVGMLDADRHVTLLASPQSLLRTGRELLAGPLAPLAEPLDAICGESIQAAGLSLHLGDACYVELDAVPAPDVPAKRLATDLADRITGLADRIAVRPAALDPDPYGRALVLRLPAMLRDVAERTRHGAEGKGAVLNAYLPRHAAHNIALAGELTLAEMSGRPGPAAGSAPPAGESPAALERLGKRITLSFASDTLERSLQLLADETGVPIEILGGDLQVEGITKNQSFALDERDKTADEILRVILAKSNPEGKLVYVVKRQDGEERVLVTTRAAAEARGDELPPASAAEAAH